MPLEIPTTKVENFQRLHILFQIYGEYPNMNLVEILQSNSSSPFDGIRKVDELGNEYWLATELLALLGYRSWKRIKDTVERATVSCINAGQEESKHFTNVVQMTQIGGSEATRKTIIDYKLSRYASYLTALNGDPRKPEIAQAQSYFAIKTREAEVVKTLSPAEFLLAQAQALLAIEREQVQIKAKQIELEAKVALEAQRTDTLEQLVHQHDAEVGRLFSPNGDYYSVMGYARNKGLTMPVSAASKIGQKCSKYCRQHSIPVDRLNDPRFGTVNSYPEDVLALFC